MTPHRSTVFQTDPDDALRDAHRRCVPLITAIDAVAKAPDSHPAQMQLLKALDSVSRDDVFEIAISDSLAQLVLTLCHMLGGPVTPAIRAVLASALTGLDAAGWRKAQNRPPPPRLRTDLYA